MILFHSLYLTAIAGNPDIDCGDPGTPDNGQRSLVSTILGSTVNYTCNEAFNLVGSETRLCQSNEEWSGQLPSCVRKYHPHNIIQTHTYYCAHTHTHTHSYTPTCVHTWKISLWNFHYFFAAVMCPILPDPDNATIFVTGQAVGSQATYICNSGFVVRPGDVIIRNCLPTGEWSGSEPQCIRRSSHSVAMQCPFSISQGRGREC